jgi:nitroreductase
MQARSLLAFLPLLLLSPAVLAEDVAPFRIALCKPDLSRGVPVMRAFANRASASAWSAKPLPLEDLSALLYAANGINRPESGKRTAPSALNAQDVDVYVFTTTGVFLYDAKAHALDLVTAGDHRAEILVMYDPAHPVALAPIELVLTSDGTRFPFGSDEQRREWGDLDVGIVSQNVSLFSAGTGLATRPRASVKAEDLKKLLNLKEGQRAVLEMPVGYAAEESAPHESTARP